MTSPRMLRNFIGGAYMDAATGALSEVVNPATGQVVAQAPVSGAEEVYAAYAMTDQAFGEWGRGKDLSMHVFEDYTRITHVMATISS